MKRKCIAICCMIALFTMLIGCNKNKEQNNDLTQDHANGTTETTVTENFQESYVEYEISSSEVNTDDLVTKNPNPRIAEIKSGFDINQMNQIEMYTSIYDEESPYHGVGCYTLVDDIFQKSTIEWASDACTELNLQPQEIFHGQDGNDYLVGMKRYSDEDPAARLTQVLVMKTDDPCGYKDITPSFWLTEKKDKNSVPIPYSDFAVSENHILCYRCLGNSELLFYDYINQKELDYGAIWASTGHVIKGNSLYYIDALEKKVRIRHLDEEKEEEISMSSLSTKSIIQVSENNDIILVNRDGIHRLKNGGTLWETIIDGSQCIMSLQKYECESCFIIPGIHDEYYVVYATDNTEVKCLARYAPMEDETKTNEKLTISSLYNNVTMREAILKYKKLHPEVIIEFEQLLTVEGGVTRTDAIRSLNTEVLAGKGPDLFLMDDLPVDDYIEKGVLMDLSEILLEPTQNRRLLNNITDVYQKDGKLYCMPMKFCVPIYGLREDVSDHTHTVEEIAEYYKEKGTKFTAEYFNRCLPKVFINTYYNEIFSEDGMLNQDSLTSFLRSISDIVEQNDNPESLWSSLDYDEHALNEGAEQRMFSDFPGHMSDFPSKEYDNMISFVTELNNDVFLSLMPLSYAGKESGVIYTSINDTFVPNGIIGINKNSAQIDIAKDFVAFVFSEEMQSFHYNDGFPVNENAIDNWITEYTGQELDTFCPDTDGDGEIEHITIEAIPKEDLQIQVSLLKTLTRPNYSDYTGKSIIYQGTIEYLEGKKTLDQAVFDLVQRMNLYLAE